MPREKNTNGKKTLNVVALFTNKNRYILIVCGGKDAAQPHLSRPILRQTEWDMLNSRKTLYDWQRPFLESNPDKVYILKPGDENEFKWTPKTCWGELINKFGDGGRCAHVRMYGDICATSFAYTAIGFYRADIETLKRACCSDGQYEMLTLLNPFLEDLWDFPIDDSKIFAWIDRKVFAACVS